MVAAPGPRLSRLRAALQVALSFGVALPVAWGFIQLAHPYWETVPRPGVRLTPSLAAKLHAQHHAVTLLALVLFGIVTVISQLGITDTRPRDQARTYVGIPVAMSAGGALGIWLIPHHTVGLVALALVCGAGAYASRFVPRLGTRAAVWGSLLFPSYLTGFLAGQAIPLHEFYWYVAIVSLAAAVGLVLQLAIYNPLAVTQLPRPTRSSPASAAAVSSGPSRLAARLRLDAPAQAAIRVALAVGAATAAGSLISEGRYYWATIAAYVAYRGGANTAREQVIKATQRTAGTVVGILLGSLVAHAIGPTTWSLAVIVPAVAVFAYFRRAHYGLAVVALTIMIAELYDLFGEYSSHLLIARLEITAVGSAIGAVVAVLVFPVATPNAARPHVDRRGRGDHAAPPVEARPT